jgi:hypothetical protein
VGPGRPKRSVGDIYNEMAEAVNDAIITGVSNDPILDILIDVVATSVIEDRHIFPNPLDEPLLYREFRTWVKEGLEDAAQIELAQRPSQD